MNNEEDINSKIRNIENLFDLHGAGTAKLPVSKKRKLETSISLLEYKASAASAHNNEDSEAVTTKNYNEENWKEVISYLTYVLKLYL